MAWHSSPSHDAVFNSEHQSMTQMKCTCDIWRWDNHRVLLCVGVLDDVFCVCVEETLSFPPWVPSCFDLFWVISCCHWLWHVFLLTSRSGIWLKSRNRFWWFWSLVSSFSLLCFSISCCDACCWGCASHEFDLVSSFFPLPKSKCLHSEHFVSFVFHMIDVNKHDN